MAPRNYSDFIDFDEPRSLCGYYCYPDGFTAEEAAAIVALGQGQRPSAAVVAATDGSDVVDSQVRTSLVSSIELSDESEWVYERFGRMANTANRELWNLSIAAMTEPLQYSEYHASNEGHFAWHLDLGPGCSKRKISVVLQLSSADEYDGGELELLVGAQPERIPKKQGSVLIFPSFILHRVTPVTAGVRRSLVVWISGEPFR